MDEIMLEEVVDDGLQITSDGVSLKTKTRNYPHTANRINSQAGQPAKMDIERIYRNVGQTLASPKSLSGLIQLAGEFSEKAASLPHIYRNNPLRVIILLLIMYISVMASLITVAITQYNMLTPRALSLITAFSLPVGLFFLTWTCCRCSPKCSGSSRLHQKLRAMEPYIDLCELSPQQFNSLFDEKNHGACEYKLVGSAGDGFGFFPSLGSNKHLLQKKSVMTQDIDLNIFLNTIRVKPENLQSCTGGKGFTWIYLDQQQIESIVDPVILKSLFLDPQSNKYVLSAAGISREALLYFKASGNAHKPQTEIVEHFPAFTFKMSTLGPNGRQIYEVDYAFALRYPHWPTEASEWLTRRRAGLDLNTVQNIVSRGCYLVHKPCGSSADSADHNHEYDWRFTFASAEADLFHYHRDKKALKMAFIILKFLIKYKTRTQGICDLCFHNYSCLCKLTKKQKEIPVLRTYHLKTIFLWMAEETTNLDYYTIKGNKTLKAVFMRMLDKFIGAVSSKRLPNYFIRDRNMLAGRRYKDSDFRRATVLLGKIRAKPTLAVQENFERQFINMKAMTGLFIAFNILLLFAYAGILYWRWDEVLTRDYSLDYSLDVRPINVDIPTWPNFQIPNIPTQPNIDWESIQRDIEQSECLRAGNWPC